VSSEPGHWPGEREGVPRPADEQAGDAEERFALSPFEDEELLPADDVDSEPEDEAQPFPSEDTEPELEGEVDEEPLPLLRTEGHAPGALDLPDGISVLEGSPSGGRRGVGIVASRFNGEITNSLLASAFAELERAGVTREAITVMPVPGAFELPLGAMALAKTRRYSCIVALGCVIRGETAHFDYVAGEAASGLQLASLETGVPVAFGVLTVDTIDQARARVDKGAEAVRTALEMADIFAQLRAAAQAARG
jgi:6,7-dimethyl-8-ribityllumazine synthase